MKLPLIWTVAVIVALPWYLAVGWATDGDWLAGFLGGHNIGRFLKPMENHSGPFFYYLLVILLGTFPWSVFLPAALWNACRTLRISEPLSPVRGEEGEGEGNVLLARPLTLTLSPSEGGEGTRKGGLLFLVCWAGVWIAFFSCARTKLPNYVLPSYPALALVMGWFVHHWQESATTELDWIFRNGCRVLAAAAVAMLIAVPIALHLFLPSEMWLTGIGVPPLIGAFGAYSLSLRRRKLAVATLAASAICLAVLVVGLAPASVARHQDARVHSNRSARALPRSVRPTGHVRVFHAEPRLLHGR